MSAAARSSSAAAVALSALALVGCGGGGGGGGNGGENAPVEIELTATDPAAGSGMATLNSTNDGTNVVLEMVSAVTEGDVQPAGIYSGTCDDLGEETTDLPDVVQGIGGATIDVSISELLASPHAIAISESAEAEDKIIACGEIKR